MPWAQSSSSESTAPRVTTSSATRMFPACPALVTRNAPPSTEPHGRNRPGPSGSAEGPESGRPRAAAGGLPGTEDGSRRRALDRTDRLLGHHDPEHEVGDQARPPEHSEH